MRQVHVLRHDHLKSAWRIFDPAELHDLGIVVQDVLVQLLRCHKDHIPLGVHESEDAGYLCSLQSLVALDVLAPRLGKCERADVDLHTTHLLGLEPVLSKVFHKPRIRNPFFLLNSVQLGLRDDPRQRRRPARLDVPRRAVGTELLRELPALPKAAPM